MKKLVFIVLTTFTVLSSINWILANPTTDENTNVLKLKNVAEQCITKDDIQSCQLLVTELGNLCQKNNSVACLELARVGVLGVQASINQKKKKEALQWLDITLTSTQKSCHLGNQDACVAFNEIKSKFSTECKKGDKFSCEISKVLQ